jgi:hypothetical protein
MRTIRHCTRSSQFAVVSTFALSLAFVACSAPDPGNDVPDYGGNPFGGASVNPGNPNGQPGPGGSINPIQNGGNTGGSGSEQPAGSNSSFGGSQNPNNPAPNVAAGGTGAGGAPSTNGTAGAGPIATGGSSGVPDPNAGSAGAPNNQPPPPSVGSGCGGASIFCEDFDGLSVGPLQGVVNGLTPERNVSIVAEAGRGQVLQVQAGRGYGAKAGVFIDNFSAANNNYFGRMFARVAQFPVAGGDHWVLVEATGAGSGEQVRPVGGQFQRWAPGSDGPSAGDWTDWQQSNAMTVAGAWECVEWQMNGANGGNDILLWVNNVQVTPMDRGNFSFPVINRLWLGWVVYQGGGEPNAFDVRIDDVVLSTERVGCN